MTQIVAPFGIGTPASSVSTVAIRNDPWLGLSSRSMSSTTAPVVSGSARQLAPSVTGSWASTTTMSLIRLAVVSLPATCSCWTMEIISSIESGSPSTSSSGVEAGLERGP